MVSLFTTVSLLTTVPLIKTVSLPQFHYCWQNYSSRFILSAMFTSKGLLHETKQSGLRSASRPPRNIKASNNAWDSRLKIQQVSTDCIGLSLDYCCRRYSVWFLDCSMLWFLFSLSRLCVFHTLSIFPLTTLQKSADYCICIVAITEHSSRSTIYLVIKPLAATPHDWQQFHDLCGIGYAQVRAFTLLTNSNKRPEEKAIDCFMFEPSKLNPK